LTLDFGYLITFVLTAFSIIATVLPFLTQTSDNQSSEIFRFQALRTLLEKPSNQIGINLMADEILHESNESRYEKNQTCQNPNACFALAAMHYNLNGSIPESLTQDATNLCANQHSRLQRKGLVSVQINESR
jgi:hypothetical protein